MAEVEEALKALKMIGTPEDQQCQLTWTTWSAQRVYQPKNINGLEQCPGTHVAEGCLGPASVGGDVHNYEET